MEGRGRAQWEGRRGSGDWTLESGVLRAEPGFIAYCVTLGKVLNLSVPEFTSLSNEDNDHCYFTVVVENTRHTDIAK